MGSPAVDENVSAIGWDEQAIPSDEAFALLADRHRRAALTCLLVHESGLPLDELVDEVVRATHQGTADVADHRERIRVAFYHKHLPKLDDAGVIDYDRGTEMVELTSAVNALEPLLEFADSL